jgi:AraC-like DNA-binding protein/mannose-6-phosphate isomerase-like protein (cupin superfamily)
MDNINSLREYVWIGKVFMHIIEMDQQQAQILLLYPDEQLTLNRVDFTAMHRHAYSEIQVATAGCAIVTVEGTQYPLETNEAMLIPTRCYHQIEGGGSGLTRIVFQADCPATEVTRKHIPGELVQELQRLVETGAAISEQYHYLFFILHGLFPVAHIRMRPLEDHRLQIREFFSLNYHRPVRLADLAAELHLSEMQTQRVLRKYTGQTFGENLLRQRMTVAENLMETTGLSLRAISEYVGYESYGGFWKAYKRFKECAGETPQTEK